MNSSVGLSADSVSVSSWIVSSKWSGRKGSVDISLIGSVVDI